MTKSRPLLIFDSGVGGLSVLRPIRERLPNLGGLDLSPVILLLIIFFLQSVIVRYIYPAVF